MAEAKQPHLNGAYYGPPAPPSKTYHRPGRGRSCCCGPCCILSTLIKLVIAAVVILGIAALIGWLVLRPSKVKFYVENASLTQFNLTNGNTLHQDLSLDISVRNPNKKVGIYYDKLEATVFYQGQRFGWVSLPTFYQGHKNTTMLYPEFVGQSVVISLGDSEVAEFTKEKAEGLFNIDVKINARIRFKVGSVKTRRFSPKVKCELKVPLVSSSSSALGFTRSKCDVDF